MLEVISTLNELECNVVFLLFFFFLLYLGMFFYFLDRFFDCCFFVRYLFTYFLVY